MFYLTLKKNYNFKWSYILVLMNSKRRILKKIGTFSFNKYLKNFILNIDLILFLFYFKNGIIFNKNFFVYILRYINFILF